MDFSIYLRQQLDIHPTIESQDIVKMCYQAAYGAEHILSDVSHAKAYFTKEFMETQAENKPIYEPVCHKYCRVNIASWKFRGLDPDFLFNMFVSSAVPVEKGHLEFYNFLEQAEKVIEEGNSNIRIDKHKLFIQNYLSQGINPVHHSSRYREIEKPAYRIVKVQYMKLLPILERITKKEDTYVIAIDGPAASGKSTLAKYLGQTLGCDVVRMDDFFLPKELRTSRRLAQPGGNVHYERFIAQVLHNIGQGKDFEYRVFDCSKMAMGESIAIRMGKFVVVEGSYSQHPLFGDYADLKIFVDVDKETQKQRILDRNGASMWERFNKEWIPMEDNYFHTFSIRKKSDIKISTLTN